MSKEKDEHINKAFALEDTFPEADGLFDNGFRSLEDSSEDALFVLDTNILLLPYEFRKETIEEIKKVYENLISESKLFIPKRVAREYSKNRARKLSEIHSNVLKLKSGKRTANIKYPIIEALKEKEEFDKVLTEIQDKEKTLYEKIDNLAKRIRKWEWSDPVSSLYGSIFNKSILIDTKYSKEDILAELNRRKAHKIPPGYKDSSKDDYGIGDLIIWLSILELGEREKKDIIFVSEDIKPDWWQHSNSAEFLPRFELIDEFRRKSSGKTLHIINFSTLLKLFSASDEAVEATKQAEERNRIRLQQYLRHRKKVRYEAKKHLSKLSREEIAEEIKEWFSRHFEDPVESCPYESREGGYIYIYGGPYDAREEIESEFCGLVNDEIIDEVASELEEISWEWSGCPDEEFYE